MTRLFLFTLAFALTSPFTVSADEEETYPDSPIRRYEGVLGEAGKVVVLLQTCDGDSGVFYDLSYYPETTGIPIALLSDGPANAEGEESFQELRPGTPEAPEEQVVGRVLLKLEDNRITGTWTSPDGQKKLPVALEERYPEGSVRLDQTHLQFASTERVGLISTGYERQLSLLQSFGKHRTPALDETLAQLALSAIAPGERVEPTVEALSKLLRAQVNAPYELEQNFINSRSDSFHVRMNEAGILTVEHRTEEYAGGAHGNYSSAFHTLSIADGTELRLPDLVRGNIREKWAALGGAQLLKDRQMKPGTSLTEIGLFEDKLELSDEWFLVPGGIGFYYAPYEIGPYAAGSFEFILPWKDISEDLEPGSIAETLAKRFRQP